MPSATLHRQAPYGSEEKKVISLNLSFPFFQTGIDYESLVLVKGCPLQLKNKFLLKSGKRLNENEDGHGDRLVI
jgi:hypothetical protein